MAPSSLPYASKDFILFTDFDGTLSDRDSNDLITDDLGYGQQKRMQSNQDVLNDKLCFRDSFKEMIESVAAKNKFEVCRQYVTDRVKINPGFNEMLKYAKSTDMPIVIVSSGMDPIIRSILSNLIGKEEADKIEIVSNYADIQPDGSFNIRFRHPESGFGHDKSEALRPYMHIEGKRPTVLFCGDGVSDLSAAAEADVLFVCMAADRHNDLAVHCARKNIPYVPFIDFTQVQQVVQALVDGKTTVQDINSGKGFEQITAQVEAVLQKAGKEVPKPAAWK